MRFLIGSLFSLFTSVVFAASEIQIEQLSDLEFGQIPPTSGTQTRTATFCVALDVNGSYRVTGVGSGPGGAFTLQNSSSYAAQGIAYQVFVNDRNRRLGRSLEPSVPLQGLRGKRIRRNQRCPRPRGRVSVRIPAAELQSAQPGRYRGTLSLLVVPE